MMQQVLAFLKDEEGLTAVEYVVAGSLIAAGVVAAFTFLGGRIQEGIFQITDVMDGTDDQSSFGVTAGTYDADGPTPTP